MELTLCVKRDGQECLVLATTYVPTASQLRELKEDGKKYTPQVSGGLPLCIYSSLPAVTRVAELMELDGF